MNKHIGIEFDKEHCCGCTACQSVCGKKAISMERDYQGFLYPVVDETKCVLCGKCISVCPDKKVLTVPLSKCYAVKRKDRKKRLSSTSGGFAASLSEQIIRDGGVVYGVAYGEFPHVINKRASSISELEQFKGSKYVQSDVDSTFIEVAEDLKQGKLVAYFATSCVINGLLLFLQAKHINSSNLVTIDLICHGVPSPKLFEEYIDWLSKTEGKIVDFQFRTKYKGWGLGSKTFVPTYWIENKTKRKAVNQNPKSIAFQRLFFSNNCLRPFCYSCPYVGVNRAADITIADYWKVQKVHPAFFDADGVSLVFVNTPKGLETFNQLSDIDSLESRVDLAAEGQGNMVGSSPKADTYCQFWKEYEMHGIDYILKKYADQDLESRMKFYIKKILKR